MKTTITASNFKKAFILITLLSLAELVHTYSGGAPSGYSNAPGEGNCTSCHAGTAISSGATWNNLTLTRTGGLNTILPNTSNTLTLNLESATSTDFGFQLCVLPNSATSSSSSIGSFSVGSNADIQTTTSTAPNRVYLTQTATGVSATSGSKSYTFNWQTPSAFAGGATFYLAFNAANGNSSSSGDAVYIKSFSVTVLPVRWLDFFITEDKGGNLALHWSTAQEKNNERFEIEASLNGVDFLPIGSLPGKGNAEQISRYQFALTHMPIEPTHFRIKQVDFDGKYTYSKVISYSPNEPIKTNFYVSVAANSIWFSQINTIQQVKIYALDGTLMAQYAHVTDAQLALPSLAAGVYILVVTEKNASNWCKKIWVQ